MSRSIDERLWKYGSLSINLFALYSISYFIRPLLSLDNGLVKRINLKIGHKNFESFDSDFLKPYDLLDYMFLIASALTLLKYFALLCPIFY